MKKRIFVDMDGTLARFYEREDCLKRMYEKGFFKNLRPYGKAIDILKALRAQGYEICVLSVCVDSPYCEDEKQKWLDKYLPWIKTDNRYFLQEGEDKAEFVYYNSLDTDINLLIDDYSKNLEMWESIFGKGTAIKAINEINNKSKENKFTKYIIVA